MLYFFSEANYRGNHAGTKARNDVETIFRETGAKPINTRVLELRSKEDEAIKANINNRLGFIRYYFDLLFIKQRTVVIQYPMLSFDIEYNYVKALSRHNRVIFLVHDIQSLRRENEAGLEKELRMLNMAYGLIVHNRFMEKKLRSIGVTVKKIYELNCFDYLYADNVEESITENAIVFAGNLEKSFFLSELCLYNPDISFKLYGPGMNDQLQKNRNLSYCGNFLPDEIPGKLKGKYGLVWDGNTTRGCSGPVGEYTKINNPHKMSLYISSGIPIIAWSQAAIAEFINQYQIGITVDRIDSLSKELSTISEKQYLSMKKNVLELRKKLIHGEFLKRVLKEIERN